MIRSEHKTEEKNHNVCETNMTRGGNDMNTIQRKDDIYLARMNQL